mmetsp:Transcript_11451/g.28906  ORF Transcript_11451/g.28906 Transcript_11451/m.28906 type:complete len:288 (+) Transcript_11451:724-1587(+)
MHFGVCILDAPPRPVLRATEHVRCAADARHAFVVPDRRGGGEEQRVPRLVRDLPLAVPGASGELGLVAALLLLLAVALRLGLASVLRLLGPAVGHHRRALPIRGGLGAVHLLGHHGRRLVVRLFLRPRGATGDLLFGPLELRVRQGFERGVEVHHDAVPEVGDEEDDGLVELDCLVRGEHSEHGEAEDVVRAIPEERPPRQLDLSPRQVAAEANYKEHVEHCRAHDRAKTDVSVTGDGRTDQRGEELGRRAAGGHEGGAGDVGLDLPPLHHRVQRACKVDVADGVEA